MSLHESILHALYEAPSGAKSAPVAGVQAHMPNASEQAAQLSPLVLAYIGDTIYDLFVRTLLVHTSSMTAHGLHMHAARHVCASAQAKAAEAILSELSPEEQAIFRRGRNAHMGTVPKNASIAEYRAATGLEAVIGYLYLCGNDARLQALMRLALNRTNDA